jgi:hypothetical protein
MDRASKMQRLSEALPGGEASARACARGRDALSTEGHRGAAIVEAVIALPILLAVILGAIQFALIYQAKATLNHASLQAARAGAVSNADPEVIRRGLARGLAPLYSPESSLHGLATTVARVNAALATDARVRILNPTREAFSDFGEEVTGVRELPNDRLHARSTAIGAASGMNVQDANILKLEVTYGHELKVPLVNWFIARLMLRPSRGGADAFEQQLLRRMRLPIVAAAVVRMQSPARLSAAVVSRDDLPALDRIPFDASRPPESDPRGGDGESDPQGESVAGNDNDGSNLEDGFLGFGSGHADSRDDDAEQPGEEDHPDQPDDGGEEAGDDSSPDEEPPPLCTPSEGLQHSGAGDDGVLGRIASELRQLAGGAWEFVQGFWDGIKGQLGDLVDLIAHPVETAKGLYRLAQSFIDAPAETARLIGEALGKDLAQLAECGGYDRGRVLGSYISPAFMLKLTAKLAKFQTLARSLDELKKDFGCASFTAGTPVWTPQGAPAIERLVAGDAVASRDAQTYADGQQTVDRTFARRAPGYYALQTEAETLHVTEEHPFWVQGRGWTPARELQVGDAVASATGDVLVLQTIPVDSPVDVFNFSVAKTESYFVGTSGLWVHNAKCDIPTPYRAPRSPSGYQPGASDGGNGKWVTRGRPDSPAIRYQQQVTGAPRDGTRVPEYEVNGVDFDGYDAERNVLIDAKHYTEVCPLADCKPEFLRGKITEDIIAQARDQIDAVLRSTNPETSIEWHIVNREMALKIEAILADAFRGNPSYADRVFVIFTPDLVN